MDLLKTPAYRRAFEAYLRRGIPLHLSLKAVEDEHPTAQYVWRTQGDGKVRPSHAANNGRIFSWDDPPETGHPGEGYGCRCTAEPYIPQVSEYAYQTLSSGISDSPKQWSNEDFLRHFFYGGGAAVNLSETGHLAGVIDYYFYTLSREGMIIYDRIHAQIIDYARKQRSGSFSYDFLSSYSFEEYLYVFGDGVVAGEFNGSVLHENGSMLIEGEIYYTYKDTFTDPVDLREIIPGSSSVNDSFAWWVSVTDGSGQYYDIFDSWSTSFKSEALLDERKSIYQYSGR